MDQNRTVGSAWSADVVVGLTLEYGLAGWRGGPRGGGGRSTSGAAGEGAGASGPEGWDEAGSGAALAAEPPSGISYPSSAGGPAHAHHLGLPCGGPGSPLPQSLYLYLPNAGSWDCYHGETVTQLSAGLRSPCVCQETAAVPSQGLAAPPHPARIGALAGLLLLPALAGACGWGWDAIFGRAIPGARERVLASAVLFGAEEVVAYWLADRFFAAGYLGPACALFGCLLLLRGCQMTLCAVAHLIPPQRGHVVVLGSAAELALGNGMEALVVDLVLPARRGDKPTAIAPSTSTHSPAAACSPHPSAAAASSPSSAAASAVPFAADPRAPPAPAALRLLVRGRGFDATRPRVVTWRSTQPQGALVRRGWPGRLLYSTSNDHALLRRRNDHAALPSHHAAAGTEGWVHLESAAEGYASSIPGTRRPSPWLDPFGMRRLPCCTGVGNYAGVPNAAAAQRQTTDGGPLACILAACLAGTGLAAPTESVVCFLAPEHTYAAPSAPQAGASEVLAELRLTQALLLSAPLFLIHAACLATGPLFSGQTQDVPGLLSGRPGLSPQAALLPLFSLFSYSLAGAGYLRAFNTHHTRRVVAPLLDSSVVGRLLELHLASDLCLRGLGLAVFLSALGPRLAPAVPAALVLAFLFWALADLRPAGGASASGVARLAACVPRFVSRLVAPRLLWSPVFLAQQHLPSEALHDAVASTAACLTLVWCGLSPRMPHPHQDPGFVSAVMALAAAVAGTKAATLGWCALPALTGHYPVLLATRLDAERQPGRFGPALLYLRAFLNAATCGVLTGCVAETFHPGHRAGPHTAFGGTSFQHGLAKGVPEPPPPLSSGAHVKPAQPNLEPSLAAKRLQASTMH